MTEPAKLANRSSEEHRREIATKLNLALQGRLNVLSTVTLEAGTTSTVIDDPRIWRETRPVLVPLSDIAAAMLPFVHVSARDNGTLTLTHTDPGTGVSFSSGGIDLKGAAWDNGSTALVAADCSEVNVRAPVAGTITKWTIVTEGGVGSCVVDVWKRSYAAGMPTVANTITAAAKPTVSAADRAQSSTLTGWTTAVAANDLLTFKVDSTSTFTSIRIDLEIATSGGGGGVAGDDAEYLVLLLG